jgi:hypothetical protein
MSQFKIKTTVIGLSLCIGIAVGVTNNSWASKTNKYAGTADCSFNKKHDFVKSNEEAQSGWKIFSWKIWDAAVPVLAIAGATAVAYAGDHVVTDSINVAPVNSDYQKNVLLEELN